MKRFVHRFTVAASLEQVARFHQDPRALKLLTPPPVWVQFHKIEPVAEGSQADFTMWMGPLPVRWLAVHSEVDPWRGFIDSQVRGPFESWVHRHTFQEIAANSAEVLDEVRAEPGRGFWRGLVSRGMWLGLPALFAYRQRATRKALERKGS